jgi:hypothetical protein
MRLISLLILTILLSCKTTQENKKQINKTDTTEIEKSKISSVDNQNAETEIIETFIDSLNIGLKGKCKVELIKHRIYEDYFVIIKFYVKGRYTLKDPETWINKNTYYYETNAMNSFEPNISDFNNDNFNDITFISATAARGANEVRRLFIYDNYMQELISIVNSEDYPNMLYNSELKCIDAFLVHGGCSTVFLKIKGDSLKMFASVELSDGLSVTTYDKNGKAKIIKEDKTNNLFYVRFKNYNPLKEYDNN